ncbi:MAG: H-type lectin domain-containing protein [Bacteroidota bacterium]
MKTIIPILLALYFAIIGLPVAQAQLAINNDGSPADPSAMLDVSSTDKGLLIPRLTTTQRNNISNPATGLMVYDLNQNSFWYYNGTGWTRISAAAEFSSNNGVNAANASDHNFAVGTRSLNDVFARGTALFLYKNKDAFRAGEWYPAMRDNYPIGRWSFAANRNTTASGDRSIALSRFSVASGRHSVALSYSADAKNDYSIAIGQLVQSTGYAATAIGTNHEASGAHSVALGQRSTVAGQYAIAGGNYAIASGRAATAWGYRATATGNYSTSIGHNNYARSFGETAIGVNNTDYTPIDSAGFDSNDRIFVIGNGTAHHLRSDAMVIYKNGNAKINGELEIEGLKDNFSTYSPLAVSNPISFGPSGKFRLDEGSWQTGNIVLTDGDGTFGFYGTGDHRLHLRTDGDFIVDGSLQIGSSVPMNKVQHGRFNVGTYSSGSGAKTVIIHFSTPFSSPPKVTITPQEANGGYNDVFVATIRSITNTSVTVNVYRVDSLGSGWGQHLRLNWIAWN